MAREMTRDEMLGALGGLMKDFLSADDFGAFMSGIQARSDRNLTEMIRFMRDLESHCQNNTYVLLIKGFMVIRESPEIGENQELLQNFLKVTE